MGFLDKAKVAAGAAATTVQEGATKVAVKIIDESRSSRSSRRSASSAASEANPISRFICAVSAIGTGIVVAVIVLSILAVTPA